MKRRQTLIESRGCFPNSSLLNLASPKQESKKMASTVTQNDPYLKNIISKNYASNRKNTSDLVTEASQMGSTQDIFTNQLIRPMVRNNNTLPVSQL